VRTFFVALALAFAAAAVFHLLAVTGVVSVPASTSGRHALFVIVNAACAAGLWRRPRGFVWLFALLTAQQLYSHGADALGEHRRGEPVDLASVVVLAGMPATLAALVLDARRKR
jgi:hypothetical protein